MKIYDMIIIGGGPAGYSAALYAARAGLDVIVIERMSVGGQMALTDVIDNYPGFDEGVDGFTLGMKMQAGAERFGAKTEYASVIEVALSESPKRIVTDSGEFFGKSVVVATGANPRRLGVDGEEELVGRGIHYCAHCDGRFYKGKTVAVVGGGNSAAEDALYLSHLAKKVYLIHRRDSLRATKIYHEPLLRAENVEAAFTHIPDWFKWERECVRKELADGTYHMNVPVDICMLLDTKRVYRVGEGVLDHSADGFHLVGCDGKLDYKQSPIASYSVYSDFYWYEIGDVICIGDSKTLYYCFPKCEGDFVAKTRLAGEELYKMKKIKRAEKTSS